MDDTGCQWTVWAGNGNAPGLVLLKRLAPIIDRHLLPPNIHGPQCCHIGRSPIGVTAERQKPLGNPDHGIHQAGCAPPRRSGKEAGPLASYSLSVRTEWRVFSSTCRPWCRRTSARQVRIRAHVTMAEESGLQSRKLQENYMDF